MENSIKFRQLRPDEIEVRVAEVGSGFARLLLYKDARCDRRILDETVGAMGWKASYREISGILYCTVSIWDETKEMWISKEDCGTAGNFEAEKSTASDAFKRACFSWGIGRALYTRTNLVAHDLKTANKGGQGSPRWVLDGPDRYTRFYVHDLAIDEEREKITHITIINQKGEIVAEYDEKAVHPHVRAPQPVLEAKYHMPDGRVICVGCEQEIQAVTGRNGSTISALDISKRTKGLCPKCYRALHPKPEPQDQQTAEPN